MVGRGVRVLWAAKTRKHSHWGSRVVGRSPGGSPQGRPRCTLVTMPELRSRTSTHGRTMAGARALWRATGMTDNDFGKPIVAIANSFTQFVPGHVHLKDMGSLVADAVFEAGGIGREFSTIAV